MGMKFDLNLGQEQRLIMTPELQQAIAILQLSTFELQDLIEAELLANPVLEKQEEEGAGDAGEDDKKSDENNEDKDAPQDELQHWEEYFSDYENDERSRSTGDGEWIFSSRERDDGFENTLQDYLLFQLKVSTADKEMVPLGEYLIGNLDTCGYLRGDVAEHASYMGVKEEQFLEALELVQSLEPAGIGARTVEECLLLQLDRCANAPPYTETVIRDYLQELAGGKMRSIARNIGISQRELQDAVDFIRTLNPKPGSYLGAEGSPPYMTADVTVEKVDSEYIVIVNENNPRLMISPFYYRMLHQEVEEKVHDFLKKHVQNALWLIKSIEQRRLTIYRVTEQIIKVQRPFLEKGINYLRPLTLKDVAASLGIHESTVSRAIANKYVQTPRGLFPLKYFFSGSISGIEGRVYSVTSIKSLIRELIDGEDSSSPVSDQRIVELLQIRGFKVSRRTVTKYRKEMGIPASFKRRRI